MKKYFLYSILVVAVFSFSGCSLLEGGSSKNIGGVLRSINSGGDWEIKNKVDDQKNISAVDVISITIDPVDSDRVYLGTKNKGLLVSEDNAETWGRIGFPAGNNVYGVAVNYFNSKVIYASGVVSGRGKIFKTEGGGENWDEIYTEPSEGTYITSMAMSNVDPNNIFVGTNSGVIFKTSNGGLSWDNLYSTKGTVAKIIFSENNRNDIYFLIYKKGVLVADNDGSNFREISDKKGKLKSHTVYSFEADKNISGALYVGTDKGLFKSADYGITFEEIDILASSKNFPIRAIAVNPFNSNEIIYSAAQAIYKSSDGGEEWSTYQLNTTKSVSDIKFNMSSSNIVFAGFRSFK